MLSTKSLGSGIAVCCLSSDVTINVWLSGEGEMPVVGGPGSVSGSEAVWL